MFEDVLSGFDAYDVLFVATTAPYYLVTFERIADAMKDRSGMMILDLSNPRTVDEKVATIGGVKLMNLDQIAEMVEKNMTARMEKVSGIEGMINERMPSLGGIDEQAGGRTAGKGCLQEHRFAEGEGACARHSGCSGRMTRRA